MTTLLAIDCATGPCSTAIWKDGRIMAYAETLKPVMQSASLIPMIEEVLSKSKLQYSDLDFVAASVGPGSFTGIRVGLAAAQGIAYAAKIPAKGYTTFEILAFGAKDSKQSLAIINAGKGEVYYQLFAGLNPLTEPQLGPLEQALAAAGPDAALLGYNAPGAEISFPRADLLAGLAATGQQNLPLKPFYIRPPDAKLPSQRNA